MIFNAVPEPRNSGKSEIRIHVDTTFETYLCYWGCHKLANLSLSKLRDINYIAKNLVLVMMLKALPKAIIS